MHIVNDIAGGDEFDEDNLSTLLFDKQKGFVFCIHEHISDKF